MDQKNVREIKNYNSEHSGVLISQNNFFLKFRFSKKATNIDEIFHVRFEVAFSENLNSNDFNDIRGHTVHLLAQFLCLFQSEFEILFVIFLFNQKAFFKVKICKSIQVSLLINKLINKLFYDLPNSEISRII